MLGDEFHVDRQVCRWCSGLMFRELRLGLRLGTGADFWGTAGVRRGRGNCPTLACAAAGRRILILARVHETARPGRPRQFSVHPVIRQRIAAHDAQ